MSQSNELVREQAVYIGLESTFGVTPSGSFPNAMTRFIAAEPVLVDGVVREMLDVNDIRVRRLDAIQPVQGLEIASKLTVSQLLKATPNAAQLDAGASTTTPLTPRILLTHVFGQEWAEQGDVVSVATSADEFDVANPNRFRVGTWIVVEVAGQMEYAIITAKATGTLSVSPSLSAAPTLGGVVRNLYGYAPAESHSSSVTAQVAYVGDSASQYTLNGCYGGIKFGFGEFGKLVNQSVEFTATSYTGPSNQSIVTTTASDEMGRGFPFQPTVLLSTAIDRAVKLVCEKFSIEYGNTWETVREPSATQTVNSVVNTAGRPRAGKVMVTLRFDGDYGTSFDAETQYTMIITQRIGTGVNASFWLWAMPNIKLTAQPKLTKVGERLYMDLEFSMLQSNFVAPSGGESPAQLDFLYAPLQVAFG